MYIGGEGVSVVMQAAVVIDVGRQDARLQHVAQRVDVQRAERPVRLCQDNTKSG